MKKIVVTGAAGQIAYSLLFRIAAGELFGPNTPLSLSLLDVPGSERALEGVAMELQDCAFPLLREVRSGVRPEALFEGVDCAFLVGAKPRGPGMERKDLLGENGKIFVEQGRALERSASKEARVLVVGNPCNTNCLIALHHAPSIPRSHFHAMTRLDQNRAAAQLAVKAKVPVEEVTQMAIWGNHSSTQVPDFFHACIRGRPAAEAIGDLDWLKGDFFSSVQKRGAEVIAARGKSSAASAAQAALHSMRSLFVPTPPGDWISLGIYAGKNGYGIEEDLVFSFPCISKGKGDYTRIEGLAWDPFLREKIALTQKELIEERDLVKDLLR